MIVGIGIAVVGVGGWGKNHVRVFRDLKGEGLIDNIVIVDIDEARGKKVARMYGVDYYKSIDDALKRDDVEGVVISTPTVLHYAHALKAIEHGKHVLVEKPMTATLDEAVRLYDEAKSSGVILMVGFIMRYHVLTDYMKNLVENGTIGKTLTATSKRTSWWPQRYGDVGVIKDLAIHDIDILHYVLKDKVSQVYAQAKKLKHDYDDYSIILLHFDNGAFAVVEANWLTPYKTRTINITGDNGIVHVDYVLDRIQILKENEIIIPNVKVVEPLLLEDMNFVRTIMGAEEPKVKGLDGIRALAVCEAALKSSEKGGIVEVEYPL